MHRYSSIQINSPPAKPKDSITRITFSFPNSEMKKPSYIKVVLVETNLHNWLLVIIMNPKESYQNVDNEFTLYERSCSRDRINNFYWDFRPYIHTNKANNTWPPGSKVFHDIGICKARNLPINLWSLLYMAKVLLSTD